MTLTKRSAVPMVNRCFRHQHPEAYDRDEVPEPSIPPNLRHGLGDTYYPASQESISEELGMGVPDARPW